MINKKQYLIDLWLFIGSIAVLLYIFFMNYAYVKNWDNTLLIAIMEIITIPIILLGSVIPVVVVYRFISKKTQSRILSMMAVLCSLMTALLIGYTTLA